LKRKIKDGLISTIGDAIREAVKSGQLKARIIPQVELQVPAKREHGDWATNVAFKMAKDAELPPFRVAEVIVKCIEARRRGVNLWERVEPVKPGFINIYLSRDALFEVLRQIEREGPEYGRSNLGRGRRVQIELVSVNPTGPLHVGHGRGAAVGDVLGNILEACGYRVSREYYINDVGSQMDILGKSTQVMYRQLLGQDVRLPEQGYKGGYIVDLAQGIIDQDGDKYKDLSEAETLGFFREYAYRHIIEGIKRDLGDFGVRFDSWFSESSLYESGRVEKVIRLLSAKGYIYEKDGALWFRSSEFCDDKDRVIRRANGAYTYLASDIAYHQSKFERGFKKLINLWGADHHGYVPRVKAAIQALGFRPDSLDVLLYQLVKLWRGKRKVSMSTRSGDFITLADLLGEVGPEVARYFFLMRSFNRHLDFDLELAKKDSLENPVYYIQYGHARICSIFKEAQRRGVKLLPIRQVNLTLLNTPEELDLMRKLALLPGVVASSTRDYGVHRIPAYLLDLAKSFHSFYDRHRVISNDMALTSARIVLMNLVRTVLRNALNLLSIPAPERM
jgi:arginyl-tRNA synthetase